MFGVQRLNKIREIILELEFVSVSTLSEMLGVSEVTIRRDLEKLENEGFINKTYGGAVLNKDYKSEKDVILKQESNNEAEDEINLISRIAVQMIQENNAIFLGGGPIGRSIAKNIADTKRILVITNDVFVATELFDKANVKVTVAGGDLVPSKGIMIGPRVIKTLQEVHVNKAFIDVQGVDFKFGYSVESYDESNIIKEIMKNADEAIALADYKKFNSISYTKLGELDLFKIVISNKEIPENYKKYYYDNFIKLYTTYEVY
ncbi:MAG TPA: DeoR/GlpR transcriptional regulator [Clostridiaceae bacterium]|nr:DeoR/GlpR transcriptional regulator [Clostridiaceae bacterium]